VGTKGMPVLIGVLKNDRMDSEIIKLALETLNILCSDHQDNNQSDININDGNQSHA
jgi:hypothetical protein